MSPQANEVLQAALQLMDAERFSLAHQILDTLPDELLTAEWQAELETPLGRLGGLSRLGRSQERASPSTVTPYRFHRFAAKNSVQHTNSM
jgi:hypothetical protein